MIIGFLGRFIDAEVKKQVDLAVKVLDDKRDRLYSSSTYPRDRHGYDRDEILAAIRPPMATIPNSKCPSANAALNISGGRVSQSVSGGSEQNPAPE